MNRHRYRNPSCHDQYHNRGRVVTGIIPGCAKRVGWWALCDGLRVVSGRRFATAGLLIMVTCGKVGVEIQVSYVGWCGLSCEGRFVEGVMSLFVMCGGVG